MKRVTNYILIVIGIIAIIIFKQITKKEIREDLIKSTLEEIKASSTENEIEEDISNQNWFTNTQFGLAFETPKKMKETNFDLPRGTEDYINNNKVYSYTLTDKDIVIDYIIMETNFTQYDTKKGLRGSVSNAINTFNGTNLNISFYDIENDYNDKECEGTFLFKNFRMKVRGYCLYNKKGRVYILIAYGVDNEITNKKMERIFNSIKIIKL